VQLLRVLVQGVQEGVDKAKGKRAWLNRQQNLSWKLVPLHHQQAGGVLHVLLIDYNQLRHLQCAHPLTRSTSAKCAAGCPNPRRQEREAKRYYDGAKELLQTTAAVADELMAAAGDSEHMTNDNCDGSCSPSSAKRRPPLTPGDLVQLIGEHMPSSWLSHKRARPEWVSDTTQQRPLPSGMQEKQKGIIEQQATSRQRWQWLAAGFWRLAWLALPFSGRLASSENEKPFSLHPLRARQPLRATRYTPPAKRQVTNFLGLRRLITTDQATHN
jgi:hypothetical protein